MSRRSLDYHIERDQTIGRPHPVRLVSALIVLTINMVSIVVAVMWSMSSWHEFIRNRGWWTPWPLAWLVGSGLLMALQIVASVVPSYAVARRRTSLPTWLRRSVILSSIAGAMITLGGFALIFAYDAAAPKPHRVGP